MIGTIGRTSLGLSVLVLAAGYTAVAAISHPHVWIEAKTNVIADENGYMAAVDIHWEFDEFYSSAAIEGLDTNGDGQYSREELHELTSENVVALRDFSYFTVMKVGGTQPDLGEVTEFHSSFENGRLTMVFTIPLDKPIDPKKQEISYQIYDPTFYIGIDLAPNDGVGLKGKMAKGCSVGVLAAAADTDNADISEDPEPDANFFAQFAQTVSVSCEGKTS